MTAITHCPKCHLLLNNGRCENNYNHRFSSVGITIHSWNFIDLDLNIQIGKSVSHPYYIMFLNAVFIC